MAGVPKVQKRVWASGSEERVAYQVRYVDRDGRRRSKQFDRKKQAETFAATVTADVRSGRHVHDRDTVTVAQACELWIEACERGRNGRDPVEPHTIRVYDIFVRMHIVPFLGGIRLNNLTPARVRRFRDEELLGGGRSRSMTKKVLGALSSVCREAISAELLAVNPCESITIHTASRHKEKVRIPTKDEVRRIMDRAAQWVESQPRALAMRGGHLSPVQRRFSRSRAIWFYAMLKFIVSTGCRLSEVRGASRAAFDVRRRIFSVIQRADERNKIGPTKSGSSRRDLELGDGLIAEVQRWLVLAPKGDLLFPSERGKVAGAQNIYRDYWLPLLVECGFARRHSTEKGARHETDFTVHDLRHFHASLMIEAGMPAKALQEHMGHASITITMDTYGHLFNDEVAKAQRRQLVVGAMDGLLDATPRPTISGSGS